MLNLSQMSLELPIRRYGPQNFVLTNLGNKVSKNSRVQGSQAIVLAGNDSVVNAAEVGNSVYIGKNVLVGQSSVIKDCCYIMDDSVLPPDSVIAPFSIVSGNPGQMPVNTSQLMTDVTNEIYYKLVPGTPNQA